MFAAVTVLLITLTALSAVCWYELKYAPPGAEGYVLIPCSRETEDIEQQVKEAYHSERLAGSSHRRVILIVLMSAGEKEYTARRLANELPGVEAVDISALADRIRRGND